MDAHALEESVAETKEEAKPWVIALARVGYAAVGLIAYGLYKLMLARYRRIYL